MKLKFTKALTRLEIVFLEYHKAAIVNGLMVEMVDTSKSVLLDNEDAYSENDSGESEEAVNQELREVDLHYVKSNPGIKTKLRRRLLLLRYPHMSLLLMMKYCNVHRQSLST